MNVAERSSSYKIRKIAEVYTGNVYGITIPRHIAVHFSGVELFPQISGTCLIFESGPIEQKREVRVHERPRDTWYQNVYAER